MTDSTDNARGPELLPCPFCGAKDGLVTHSAARGVYVECKDGCGAYGPDADNGDWNMRRADLAPDPLRAVRVKPLVWTIGSHKSDYGDHIAQSLLGEYSIRDDTGRGFTLWFRERCLHDLPHGVRELYNTVEAAKAAAQADYETRIRSALEPDPQDVRVALLEKALSVAMGHLTPMQPGDSRAVDDWFVACAAVQCDLDDDDGKINVCLDEALAAFDKGGKDE